MAEPRYPIQDTRNPTDTVPSIMLLMSGITMFPILSYLITHIGKQGTMWGWFREHHLLDKLYQLGLISSTRLEKFTIPCFSSEPEYGWGLFSILSSYLLGVTLGWVLFQAGRAIYGGLRFMFISDK